MGLTLKDPLVIGRNQGLVLLVAADDQHDPRALGQLWSPTMGYSHEVRPVQVWLKFVPFAAVEPPEAWQEPGTEGSQ